MASKACDACGETKSLTYKVIGGEDCAGSIACSDCCKTPGGCPELYARIRSRRAARDAGPRDADGVVIRVGDHVRHHTGSNGVVKKLVGKVHGEFEVKVAYSRGPVAGETLGAWASALRHVPAPPQGEASGDDEKEPRAPGCQCHQEVGDSPCRVHGEEEDDPADTLHFGPDTYPADPSYAIAGQPDYEPVVVPRNESYEAFRAAVEQHLVPRLPRGFRVVTDTRGCSGFMLEVLDKNGREIKGGDWVGHHFSEGEAISLIRDIASALMAERERVGR